MELPSHFRQVSTHECLRIVWSSREPTLELPEILWARFLPRWLLCAAAWRLSSRRREQGTLGFFAIENSDPYTALFGVSRVRPFAGPLAVRLLRLWLRFTVDRVAFGTPGAATTYSRLLAGSRVAETTMLDLIPAKDGEARRAGKSAVFVGALEPRKGVDLLMSVWPEVEAAEPDAELTLVGAGPLAESVQRWVSERPTHRRATGALPREEVLRAIQCASVLVAPSIRWGRWREQVGRPIQEALALGTAIVTSEETGLAVFLHDAGQTVLGSDRLEAGLAAAIVRVLRSDPATFDARPLLPIEAGRIEADRWLHS